MSYPNQPNQGPSQRNVPHSGQPAEWPRYGQPRLSPPYGAPSPYGTPQPPYGTPQPPYGTPPPPYGTTQQPYGTPPQPSYGGVRRPWTVTRAVGAAFVFGLIWLLTGVPILGYMFSSGHYGLRLFIGAAISLVFVVSYLWGAVAALRGRTSHILFWTSVAAVIFAVVMLILAIVEHDFFAQAKIWFPILVPPIWIILCLLTPSSREFFRARGGTTI